MTFKSTRVFQRNKPYVLKGKVRFGLEAVVIWDEARDSFVPTADLEYHKVPHDPDQKPQTIRIDSGTEYVSGKLMEWAEKQGVRLEYIQSGKPQQNAYIERYNRTVRSERPPLGVCFTNTCQSAEPTYL